MIFALKPHLMGLLLVPSLASNTDRFRYGDSEGRDLGPKHWGHVTCDDVDFCVSCDIVNERAL